MNRLLKTTLATLALSITALAAQAQPAGAASTPRVDQRQANQQARIAEGAATGQLTPRETRRLEREQAAINRTEARAKADGTVTPQERKHLAHMQNRASRHIKHEKHDAQGAASAPRR